MLRPYHGRKLERRRKQRDLEPRLKSRAAASVSRCDLESVARMHEPRCASVPTVAGPTLPPPHGHPRPVSPPSASTPSRPTTTQVGQKPVSSTTDSEGPHNAPDERQSAQPDSRPANTRSDVLSSAATKLKQLRAASFAKATGSADPLGSTRQVITRPSFRLVARGLLGFLAVATIFHSADTWFDNQATQLYGWLAPQDRPQPREIFVLASPLDAASTRAEAEEKLARFGQALALQFGDRHIPFVAPPHEADLLRTRQTLALASDKQLASIATALEPEALTQRANALAALSSQPFSTAQSQRWRQDPLQILEGTTEIAAQYAWQAAACKTNDPACIAPRVTIEGDLLRSDGRVLATQLHALDDLDALRRKLADLGQEFEVSIALQGPALANELARSVANSERVRYLLAITAAWLVLLAWFSRGRQQLLAALWLALGNGVLLLTASYFNHPSTLLWLSAALIPGLAFFRSAAFSPSHASPTRALTSSGTWLLCAALFAWLPSPAWQRASFFFALLYLLGLAWSFWLQRRFGMRTNDSVVAEPKQAVSGSWTRAPSRRATVLILLATAAELIFLSMRIVPGHAAREAVLGRAHETGHAAIRRDFFDPDTRVEDRIPQTSLASSLDQFTLLDPGDPLVVRSAHIDDPQAFFVSPGALAKRSEELQTLAIPDKVAAFELAFAQAGLRHEAFAEFLLALRDGVSPVTIQEAQAGPLHSWLAGLSRSNDQQSALETTIIRRYYPTIEATALLPGSLGTLASPAQEIVPAQSPVIRWSLADAALRQLHQSRSWLIAAQLLALLAITWRIGLGRKNSTESANWSLLFALLLPALLAVAWLAAGNCVLRGGTAPLLSITWFAIASPAKEVASQRGLAAMLAIVASGYLLDTSAPSGDLSAILLMLASAILLPIISGSATSYLAKRKLARVVDKESSAR